MHRHRGCRRIGHQPAVGLHDQERAAHTDPIETRPERRQVAADDRQDVRVDHRGRRPLVFFDLRQHLAADAQEQAWGAPLDEADVGRALDRLLAQGIEALSVCLLNAWANPVHEERIRSIVVRRAPGLLVCLSSEVLPEIKEYERTSTTVINTYVLPIVRRYLATLRAGLDAIAVRGPLLI
ncbi:MAG TPA: hydantoinase/oxoprolinase N-terminal domain-containing protein, partial [Solirubrobacteraceae bacterium]